MNILISNDDGIHAPGLRVLADALSELGKVWVVAPDRERSASGHSLTLNRPLRITKVAPTWFTVDGTPTDCVALALMGMIDRKFDLVASGINVGGNMGDDVTYSGTVSAAFEATLLGFPAFALSVVARRRINFNAARLAAVMVAKQIAKNGLPSNTMLNVNVPNCSPSAIKGVAITQQGRRRYGDIIVRKVDPRGKAYYWIGGKEPTWEPLEESDHAAVTAGSISITPLHLDLTNWSAVEELRSWAFPWERVSSTAWRRRATA
ncbi:stationary phase survival protein SurE [Candidatus Methylomirabilis lanthanidiphila]|uniref:5'-nucleotidase SurE n=1 Tax=Candidatus Methylomirabilis lanthanidiphila TaxID=2211376 RepID=A0A564ZGF0_9BACT|nr:5'/3'-nucleotidase SurE [Candidatus Methylomirabilis lanthanidiphila]VUZ83967.1 stationary phase survival protein SurE [Candidatus Methylomirabilis lanthanidiphila]